MNIKRHHFYTLLISVGMLLFAVALLFVNEWFSQRVDPQVLVREVHMASLPPPPPPPPPQKTVEVEQTISISLEGDGAAMDVSLVKVDTPKLQLTPPPMNVNMSVDFNESLAIDWQAFGLDELDDIPRLLTRVKTVYPRVLVKQGILQTIVKLDVFIDETGKPSLVAIRSKHQKALSNTINELIKRARFTPPTKDGQPVSARFVWPVEFQKS